MGCDQNCKCHRCARATFGYSSESAGPDSEFIGEFPDFRKPSDTQEGGDHYVSMAIQPIEFIDANKIGFCEGNVIKYICRHQNKNGSADIRKAIHYCKLILEYQYGETDDQG